MSHTTHTPAAAGPAPWRPLFLSHLAKMPSPEFVLSTLHAQPAGSDPPYLPSARFCIYRGMFAELPPNHRNDRENNPHVYESDMPTFTTDVRTQKVLDLFSSSAGHGDEGQCKGTGGGGPVEAAFWIKEVMTQWRIRGVAYLIGPDVEDTVGDESSGVRTVKSELGKRMRIVPGKEAAKHNWSWQRELDAQFGNLSPGMRGSFKNPPPGVPVGEQHEDIEMERQHALGMKAATDDKLALENFRVVVIVPNEVEAVDLTNPDQSRRWKYTFVRGEEGSMNEWKMQELWP